MHSVGHAAPAGHLRRGAKPRRARITLAHGRDIGAFADDQPGAGALGVVVRHQRVGFVARLGGARAGHGRHHDAVG
ncbi:hypothetical protein G6F40_018148 [Rhizopus arrhizus]|nr:hypothetical protein G6F40_018148 [Rhizopus arrhizus]